MGEVPKEKLGVCRRITNARPCPPLSLPFFLSKFPSEDLRRWLLQQEAELFRFRLENMYTASMLDFLHLNNLSYTAVSAGLARALNPFLIYSSLQSSP